ncbi:MAG TPA: hypothetical protein VFS49_04695 [Croceibacterium sp.]|nr:hypothetical protein [Croceibacterium sp.]
MSTRGINAKALPMDEAKQTREERLAAKLRENLRRRKAQARALESRDDRGDDGLPKPPERG